MKTSSSYNRFADYELKEENTVKKKNEVIDCASSLRSCGRHRGIQNSR